MTAATEYVVGQRVASPIFGSGTVTGTREEGGNTVVSIAFDDIGEKELLARYSSLTDGDGTTYETVFSDYAAFDRKVTDAAQDMRVREAAKALLAAEKEAANPADPFDVGTLREILERPAEPPMRVEGLIPSRASALLVAQRKTGKTTLTLNWARSLIDGTPLLGTMETRPIDGNVGMLNFEVSSATVARWADEQGIDPDRLVIANLRGRRNPLAHPDDRAELAAHLREHDVEALAVDPFGRAYNGTSQNDAGEVGAWLVSLDAFARSEVGATDVLLTAHAGWNGERSRGSTALEDWADVIITMTRDQDDDSQRFIRATGRDIELEEDRLDFDPDTRTLTLAGVGSRKAARSQAKVVELAVFVERVVHAKGEVVGRAALEELVKGEDDAPAFRNGDVSKAADHLATQGLLTVTDSGPGRPKIFRAVTPKGF